MKNSFILLSIVLVCLAASGCCSGDDTATVPDFPFEIYPDNTLTLNERATRIKNDFLKLDEEILDSIDHKHVEETGVLLSLKFRFEFILRVIIWESPYFLQTDDLLILRTWDQFAKEINPHLMVPSKLPQVFHGNTERDRIWMRVYYSGWSSSIKSLLEQLEEVTKDNKNRLDSRFYMNQNGLYCHTANLKEFCEVDTNVPVVSTQLEFKPVLELVPFDVLQKLNTLNSTVEAHISRAEKAISDCVDYHQGKLVMKTSHVKIHRIFEHVYEREGIRFLNWLIREYGTLIIYMSTLSESPISPEIEKLVDLWNELIQEFRTVYRHRKGVDVLNSLQHLHFFTADSMDPDLQRINEFSIVEYGNIYHKMLSSPSPVEKIRNLIQEIQIVLERMSLKSQQS